jgi:diphosphomevalonate decarboxylase
MKGSRHKNLTSRTNHETLKYWGKRDAELNLPTNSSISVTLNQDDLKTTTTATASPAYDEDILWLNGSKEAIEKSKRTQTLFQELRRLRKELEDKNKVCLMVESAELYEC